MDSRKIDARGIISINPLALELTLNRTKDYFREGIRRLIEAASNPDLSDDQAEVLLDEARENAEIAFGLDADKEFSEIVRQHIRAILS